MNRLAAESSPYLRQHADNPVDWFPWSDEAFAVARERNVPVLLSVGYSSCHWCHVMAHESFEDDATARVMNDHFVNVKVDREERPDIDAIYMDAVQQMTGRGGWPMTVFLTPDGRPFFGGTYFPKVARPGMPAFTQLLHAIAAAWRDNRAEVIEQGALLTARIAEANPLATGTTEAAGPELIDEAVARLVARADGVGGGFGPAPKFPMAMALRFLALAAARTADPDATAIVTRSLDAMAAGGIHDHVGGGFHRYSTDSEWLVPHFEKMLYDQATLLRAYAAGYALTGDPTYRRVASGIVGYVLRDLQDAAGGWYAAEDADSEGIEGKFFCWQPAELRDVLGADADAVIAWSAATDAGNFTDPHTGFRGTILHAADGDAATPAPVLAALDRLRTARDQRVRPGLDDKVLLGWNAMFARALAEAAALFGEPAWMDAARRNVRFLLDACTTPDGFARSWQDGVAQHRAVLEDVGALLGACVTLAELDDPAWIATARTVADALTTYQDPDGAGWFTTAPDVELIVRLKDFDDNAVPSGNSLAADGLLRLGRLTADPSVAAPAAALCAALGSTAARHALGFGFLLESVARTVTPSREIVIVADPARRAPFVEVALRALGLNDTVVVADVGTPALSPLLTGRVGDAAEQPRAYVCHDGVCDLPTDDVDGLAAQLH